MRYLVGSFVYRYIFEQRSELRFIGEPRQRFYAVIPRVGRPRPAQSQTLPRAISLPTQARILLSVFSSLGDRLFEVPVSRYPGFIEKSLAEHLFIT